MADGECLDEVEADSESGVAVSRCNPGCLPIESVLDTDGFAGEWSGLE